MFEKAKHVSSSDNAKPDMPAQRPADKSSAVNNERLCPSPVATAIADYLQKMTIEKTGQSVPVSAFMGAATEIAKAAGRKISERAGRKDDILVPGIVGLLFEPGDVTSATANPDRSMTFSFANQKTGKTTTGTLSEGEMRELMRSVPLCRQIIDGMDAAEKLDIAFKLVDRPAEAIVGYFSKFGGKQGKELGEYIGIREHGELSLNLDRVFGVKELAGYKIRDFRLMENGAFKLSIGDKHSSDGLYVSMILEPGKRAVFQAGLSLVR